MGDSSFPARWPGTVEPINGRVVRALS
jgi:hypothetical protein